MAKVITIDGPAASGKSSVSRELAKRLGWSWVSTGSFYRGLAYVAQQEGVDLKDVHALATLAKQEALWHVQMQAEKTLVMYKGGDVTALAHSEAVGTIASQISQYAEVRKSLLEQQRQCAIKAAEGLIAEGRDCGSVVFPGAQVKIYLTANQGDRASRRAIQMGQNAEAIQKDQEARDARDSERKVAPLQVPENAHVVDTSTMDLKQVVDHVESLVRPQIS